MTVRSYHIESTEGILKDQNKFTPGTRYFGKGLGKEYKAVKRAEAVTRQEKNLERGYYITQTGKRMTPSPSAQFRTKAERELLKNMKADAEQIIEVAKEQGLVTGKVRVMTPDEKAAKKERLHRTRWTKA
jgi:uncharacterized membrane-anchored protein